MCPPIAQETRNSSTFASDPRRVDYNDGVHVRWAVAVVILNAAMLAQSEPPCPAGRPVDELIAEVHKQQSKRKNRNPNPFPEVICIWGWCRDREVARTPPTFPSPVPAAPSGGKTSPNEKSSSSKSSSKTPADKCNEAMERALEAAHNVEVGDFSSAQKNYRGALMRYSDALQDKPDDPAIHVRLGRVFEKLNQVPEAIEQYKVAQKLPGPEKWAEEAAAALLRLQPPPRS